MMMSFLIVLIFAEHAEPKWEHIFMVKAAELCQVHIVFDLKDKKRKKMFTIRLNFLPEWASP